MFIKRLIDRFRGDPLKEPASRRPAPTKAPIAEPSQQQEEKEPLAEESVSKESTEEEVTEPTTAQKLETEEPQGQQESPEPSEGTEPEEANADDLCGITPGMSAEEIRKKLAVLYRRHNASASSLDQEMRTEAEMMLEAIVEVRHCHFGE